MKRVKLDDISTFFHFSPLEQKQSIECSGLLAKIGDNAVGIEHSPKVFFSKGKLGMLETCDVWIKWMMNRAFGITDKYEFYQGKNLQERKKGIDEWNREFISREYLNDKEKLERVFEIVYQSMQRQEYYRLDLIEGIDFNYQDIDEAKEEALRKKSQGNIINYIYQKEMYGDFSNIESPIMDSWNMHTKPYKEIEKEKISQVITAKGRTDSLSIIQEVYEAIGKNRKWDVLDDFMFYAYQKEELESKTNKKNIELDNMLEEYDKNQEMSKSLPSFTSNK